MEDDLCLLCNSPALQAVTCDGCGSHYCATCHSGLEQTCKRCNKKNSCQVNHVLRQSIVRCQDCLKGYNVEKLKVPHKSVCPRALTRCSFCSSEYLRDEICMHLYQVHYFSILSSFGEPVYRIITHIGRFVQLYVLYSIHAAVYYEVTCIEDHLLMHSTHDRDFNHLTGWPIYFLTLFYYFKTCTKHPGKVRKGWDFYCKDEKFGVRLCEICKVSKPFRASHCKRCKKCISRRDHHCIFTNNCIGFDNHKAFLWFLTFGFLGSLHFIVRGSFWVYEWYYGDRLSSYSTVYAMLLVIHVYNMLGFSGLLCYLGFKTIKNIHCNAVTMDSWTQKICCGDGAMNGFDLGVVYNWTAVLGENPLLWFSTSPPARHSITLGPEFPKKPEYLF